MRDGAVGRSAVEEIEADRDALHGDRYIESCAATDREVVRRERCDRRAREVCIPGFFPLGKLPSARRRGDIIFDIWPTTVQALVTRRRKPGNQVLQRQKALVEVDLDLFLDRRLYEKYVANLQVFCQRVDGNDLAGANAQSPVLGDSGELVTAHLLGRTARQHRGQQKQVAEIPNHFASASVFRPAKGLTRCRDGCMTKEWTNSWHESR
jgi:hypothetical protein